MNCLFFLFGWVLSMLLKSVDSPASLVLLCDTKCELGEGVFSVGKDLYFFDINTKSIHSINTENGGLSIMSLSEHFSAGGIASTGEFLLASETGLWLYDPVSMGLIRKLENIEEGNFRTRSNDGRTDRQGGFWVSTMGKNAEFGLGGLYRYYRGEVTLLRSGMSIPNAICFSPTGDFAYFADSAEQLIYRWQLDHCGWPIGDPIHWVDLGCEPNISPDGAVIDSSGFMWNTQWGGSRVVRYSPDGVMDKIVRLPVSRPTCPAFFGVGLEKLVVTSAREGLSSEELLKEPTAGGVYCFSLAVKGLADCTVLIEGVS